MKKLIKKIGIVLSALALVGGICVVNDSRDVYADTTVTATFHYTTSDGNYDGYEFKAYTVTNNNGTGTISGTLENGEVTFVFPFSRTEDDDYIFFYAHKAEGNITWQPEIDITNITDTAIDIYVNGDTGEYSLTKSGDDTGTDEPSSEVATGNYVGSSGENETTEKADIPDDENADYSVGTLQVILLDVLFLVVVGGISFYVFGKEKKSI